MRRGPVVTVTVMVILVGTVLAVSVQSLRRSSARAMQDLQASQSRLAEDAASALTSYLDSFDKDTRLLAALTDRTLRQAIDARGQDRIILATFDALATVVSHYRTIALFGSRPAPLVAIDPTEDRTAIAPALVRASAPLAQEASRAQRPILRGPVAIAAGRWFYLYAAPVGGTDAVVVTADAALMLEVVWRHRAGLEDLVVVDPNGNTWFGCEDRRQCRLLRPGEAAHRGLAAVLDAAGQPKPIAPPPEAAPLGLPRRLVVGAAAPPRSPLGPWSVAMLASATELDARDRALLWQLVLTSAGVIGAMLTAGVLIIRQQTRAAALGARLQAAEEMATLRERSEKILENVPVGILGMTREARAAMANRFFHDRIEPGHGDLAGWSSRLRPALDRALATGRTQLVTDVEVGTNPTDVHDYDVRVVPLSRPADEIEALVLLEDLSDLRSLQRQLVRAEKLVTVGVLSAGIAHEVGTPLTVIRGRAEHLLERMPEASAAEDLRAIVAQIDRISSIIRQVLEFSRARPLEVGPTNARAGVARALELLEWRIQKKQLTVLVEADVGLPSIAADPQQFEQVVVNLVMNACDASPTGATIDIALGTEAAGPGARLRLDVVDRGAGIAAQHLNAVFDPYFTTKKRGEGTGLGLTIVSQVVRSHHGEVTLASTLGAGTTVTVLWPTAPESAADGREALDA